MAAEPSPEEANAQRAGALQPRDRGFDERLLRLREPPICLRLRLPLNGSRLCDGCAVAVVRLRIGTQRCSGHGHANGGNGF